MSSLRHGQLKACEPWLACARRSAMHYRTWLTALVCCAIALLFYTASNYLSTDPRPAAARHSLAALDNAYGGSAEQYTLLMSHLLWFNGYENSYSVMNRLQSYMHPNISQPFTNDMTQVLHSLSIKKVALVGPFDLPLAAQLSPLEDARIEVEVYSCEEMAGDVIPDATLIVVGNCVPSSDALSYDTIYNFYDALRQKLSVLRQQHPHAIIAWAFPFVGKQILSEKQMLHEHLIIRHLIGNDKVLVMFPQVIAEKGGFRPRLVESQRGSLSRLVWESLAAQLSQLSRSGYRLLRSRSNRFTSLAELCNPIINSRKYVPDCMPKPKILKPLLVTGLGGAGTHSISAGLEKMSILAAHEKLSRDGSVCWFYAANDQYAELPYPHHAYLPTSTYLSPRFDRVYHVTRCPLKQISAFTTHLPASYDFVRRAIKLSEDPFFMQRMFTIDHTGKHCKRGGKCHFYLAAVTWLWWNRHVEKYADKRVRIEDSPWATICTETFGPDVCNTRRTNAQHRYLPHSQNSTLPKKLRQNRRVHLDFHIADVAALDKELAIEIEALARRYGYGDECL